MPFGITFCGKTYRLNIVHGVGLKFTWAFAYHTSSRRWSILRHRSYVISVEYFVLISSIKWGICPLADTSCTWPRFIVTVRRVKLRIILDFHLICSHNLPVYWHVTLRNIHPIWCMLKEAYQVITHAFIKSHTPMLGIATVWPRSCWFWPFQAYRLRIPIHFRYFDISNEDARSHCHQNDANISRNKSHSNCNEAEVIFFDLVQTARTQSLAKVSIINFHLRCVDSVQVRQ